MKTIRFFMLILAIQSFLFSPLISSYAFAAENIHLPNSKENYDYLECEDAIKELKGALNVSGNSTKPLAQIHQLFGYSYIALEENSKALASFKEALKLDPSITIETQYRSPKIVEVFNKAKVAIAKTPKKQADSESPTIIGSEGSASIPTAKLSASENTAVTAETEKDTPIYKKWWFWAILGGVVAGAGGGGGGGGGTPPATTGSVYIVRLWR